MSMKNNQLWRYLSLGLALLMFVLAFALPIVKPAPFYNEIVDEAIGSELLDTIGFRPVTYFTVLFESLLTDKKSLTTGILLTGSDHLVTAIMDLYAAFESGKSFAYSPPVLHYGLLLQVTLLLLAAAGTLQFFTQLRAKLRHGIGLTAGLFLLASTILIWARVGVVNHAFLEYLDDNSLAQFLDIKMLKTQAGLFILLGGAVMLSAAAMIGLLTGRQAIPAAAGPFQPGAVQIRGLTGTFANGTFNLRANERIVFGRDANTCQVVFDQFDTSVSRQHCTVMFEPNTGRYTVIDHSRNGTFTQDGKRLETQVPVQLDRGSVIYLGNRKNTFRLE
ncbi:MAG: FHA domain-containing protein [Clostridiaceae bacterium]|nr:FHA domain-containing protein [Clostridiaceae bacterium]